VSIPLLGVLMFIALREYFFLAPARPKDRWAILAAYGSIPLALWPVFRGDALAFLAVIPVALFVFLPVLVSISPQAGFVDSVGRLFFGVTAFVFCSAHLGLLVTNLAPTTVELYAIVVLAAELPQRLLGRSIVGVAVGAAAAVLAGTGVGPSAMLDARTAAIAGLLAALGTAVGAFLAEAVSSDLKLGVPASRVGRGALLDRAFPAVYAAPGFFHYVSYVVGPS
jgi:predicted CDP-diglyceride synthetase/phosphatidate cytidylyltransferase